MPVKCESQEERSADPFSFKSTGFPQIFRWLKASPSCMMIRAKGCIHWTPAVCCRGETDPATPDGVADYAITPHAVFEMGRRGLNEEIVRSVLSSPVQRLGVRPGRVVLQSRVSLGEPAWTYRIRVIVNVDRTPAEVGAAYRTSKIARYWEGGHEG